MKHKKIYGLIFLTMVVFQNLFAASDINIYQNTQAGMMSPAVKDALYRVYVPNSLSGTVSVIDPTTYKVIDGFETGKQPQHVIPSYDLQTLWVLNDRGNSVTPIDPRTSKPGRNIHVDDPYNMYFTPDGQFAIVVCEARKQLEFRDPKTMALKKIIPIQCRGANHMDFTPDGQYAIATCEYSGQLMKIDLTHDRVLGYLALGPTLTTSPLKATKSDPSNSIPIHICSNKGIITIFPDGHIAVEDGPFHHPRQKIFHDPVTSMPQDVRSSADGKVFYVADMLQDGVVLIDPIRFVKTGFIPTGIGTHAVYPSRDGKLFYISNRGCHFMQGCRPHGPGSISVIDPTQNKVIATWSIPGGGSPDMGNVTANGKELWLSGRYDSEVYVFDTVKGQLAYRIPVGLGPHGLTVWPQPGRYSLGHTGNMR